MDGINSVTVGLIGSLKRRFNSSRKKGKAREACTVPECDIVDV